MPTDEAGVAHRARDLSLRRADVRHGRPVARRVEHRRHLRGQRRHGCRDDYQLDAGDRGTERIRSLDRFTLDGNGQRRRINVPPAHVPHSGSTRRESHRGTDEPGADNRKSLDHSHGTQDTFVRPMRIFSGIQPSGDPHIGNFSGGFRQYAQTQERGEAFFCIVDREGTLDFTAMLFATGLDPERSTVFVQSHVTAHAEAAWLLSSVTSYGQLGRMTQFKEKSEDEDFISAALFTYPVLMAGDILLYRTDIVPIGEDQRQHLELTRDIAQRFNSRYGETFVVPEGVYPETGGRVMNLQEPDVKMSKSRGAESGTVLMLDPPDTIRKKVKSAVTDSGSEVRYDPEQKAGISNLIELMTVVTGSSIPDVEARYEGSGYGRFKEDVAEAVVEVLAPIQPRYRELRADVGELDRLLQIGADKAREASALTLELMYERLGFARP